jgi:hypothetical protein
MTGIEHVGSEWNRNRVVGSLLVGGVILAVLGVARPQVLFRETFGWWAAIALAAAIVVSVFIDGSYLIAQRANEIATASTERNELLLTARSLDVLDIPLGGASCSGSALFQALRSELTGVGLDTRVLTAASLSDMARPIGGVCSQSSISWGSSMLSTTLMGTAAPTRSGEQRP